METTRLVTVAAAAAALALVPLGSASAAPSPSSPAQQCRTVQVPGGPDGGLAPLVGEGGYFAKLGGCASTLAHGGLDDPEQLSALTTRAGYVQTCQLIREVEGFPFDFGYPWIEVDQEVSSIGECATVLKVIHTTPFPE